MKGKGTAGCMAVGRALVLAMFGIALMATAAGAQVQGTATATILGTVTDPSGAPAAGATSTLR